ncbi:MAG TPA: ANTAR domain-containing protein [Candidatus Tectomicrobia bacterium]|nr:ANTAR domain-containing protein [Candidatus Tectomicrobia bacterium]
MIVDDHERSRLAMRAAIWAAGGTVAGEATRCADVPCVLERVRPDVAVFAVGMKDGDGIEAAASVIETYGVPVVLSTSHAGDDVVARARAAGIMAWLAKPLRPGELAPTLDLAIARFEETRRLRQALEDRKVIDRAKGRLMDRFGLSEDQAFHRLRKASMDARRPMADIARAVLACDPVSGEPADAGGDRRGVDAEPGGAGRALPPHPWG